MGGADRAVNFVRHDLAVGAFSRLRGKVAPKVTEEGGPTLCDLAERAGEDSLGQPLMNRVRSRPLHQLRWSPSPATASQERTPTAIVVALS